MAVSVFSIDATDPQLATVPAPELAHHHQRRNARGHAETEDEHES